MRAVEDRFCIRAGWGADVRQGFHAKPGFLLSGGLADGSRGACERQVEKKREEGRGGERVRMRARVLMSCCAYAGVIWDAGAAAVHRLPTAPPR